MDGFDLYREAKEDYERLVPDKKKGLILLSLFTRFGELEFKEENIIEAIELVFKDLEGKEASRTEYQRNNKLIIEFQNNFLWRDKIKLTYRFRAFGLEFFKAIHERLESSYNPAKIKRIFDELLNSFKKETNKSIQSGFSIWFEDQFLERKDFLSHQIENLDEQVNRSVESFKVSIKEGKSKTNIMSVLQEIESKLEEIKKQASEMKQAFRATYDIDDMLTDLLKVSLGSKLELLDSEQTTKVYEFNKQVRVSLEQISNRIEKIKPRIRDFYSDFNRSEFERKSTKFLNYLMNYSIPSGNEKNKFINPPSNVPIVKIRDTDLHPVFTAVPNKIIEIKRPISTSVKEIDLERHSEFLTKTKSFFSEKEKINNWTNEALKTIDEEGRLDLSDYFFHILKSESFDLSISVKAFQQILKKCRKINNLKVCIEQIAIKDKEVENIEIWKTNIYQK